MKYRSGLEKRIAAGLPSSWEYEPFTVPYSVHRKYKPDFVRGDYLIEAKGYFRESDCQKYKAIRDCLKEEQELIFVLHNPHTKVRKGSKLSMSQWCEKEGFSWYTVDTLPQLVEDYDSAFNT
jgi:hypothetical protein